MERRVEGTHGKKPGITFEKKKTFPTKMMHLKLILLRTSNNQRLRSVFDDLDLDLDVIRPCKNCRGCQICLPRSSHSLPQFTSRLGAFFLHRMQNYLWEHNEQFQKISILPPQKVSLFCTPSLGPPPRNSSLATYFALKI